MQSGIPAKKTPLTQAEQKFFETQMDRMRRRDTQEKTALIRGLNKTKTPKTLSEEEQESLQIHMAYARSRKETEDLSSDVIASVQYRAESELRKKLVNNVLKDFECYTPLLQSVAVWEKQKDRNGKTRLIHAAGFCDDGVPLPNGSITRQQGCILVILSKRFPTLESVMESDESQQEFEFALKTAIKAGNIYFFLLLLRRKLIPDTRIWDECLNALNENFPTHQGNIEALKYLFQVIRRSQLKCDMPAILQIYDAICCRDLDKEKQTTLLNGFLNALDKKDGYFNQQLNKLQKEAIDKGDLEQLKRLCQFAKAAQTETTILEQSRLLTYVLIRCREGKLSRKDSINLRYVILTNSPSVKENNNKKHAKEVGDIREMTALYWGLSEDETAVFAGKNLDEPATIQTLITAMRPNLTLSIAPRAVQSTASVVLAITAETKTSSSLDKEAAPLTSSNEVSYSQPDPFFSQQRGRSDAIGSELNEQDISRFDNYAEDKSDLPDLFFRGRSRNHGIDGSDKTQFPQPPIAKVS